MKFPYLTEIQSSRQMIDVFGGYNHNLRINDGEFYDMKNLTSSHYPALSPRGKRGTYANEHGKIVYVANPLGMIAKDALCYVDGEYFVINEHRINLGLSTDPDDCPKRLVSMGAYVVIFPDGKWVNTANLSGENGYGSINASFTNKDTNANITFTPCGADGVEYQYNYTGALPNDVEFKNGDKWLDTTSTPHSVKVYSSDNGTWNSIATTYIKIESPGIARDFERYDGVTISGLGCKDGLCPILWEAETGRDVSNPQLNDIDGSFVIWDKDETKTPAGDGSSLYNGNWILIVGMLDEKVTITNSITIKREMPKMDFVIESQNRLWGCRYGPDNNGNVVNEIYASKLGDFKNWDCFMSVSTDSYTASVGTDGQFTGAITHLGYPIFFKEGYMHKVYGNYPANYQIQTTACRGVQSGCGNSLAIVNEVLYYKSRTGVVGYDGSLPIEVSSALGDVPYSNAVACGHGNKYYISMMDENEEYHLFVYDTKKGMWHREDDTRVDEFCSCRNELYFREHGSNEIKTMFGSGTMDTDPVEWMAETGPLVTSSPDKKYISRLNVRMSLAIGSVVHFYIQYDSSGEWYHASTMTGTVLRPFSVPVRPRRCDHFKLRIVGKGEAKIHSITKTIEQGSDL